MRRQRNAKIVTTIGPASRESTMLEALFERGADVFRLNFSHGSHEDHQLSYDRIRAMEAKFGRATCILADIQGPKLRLGTFANGAVEVEPGHVITLVLEEVVGTAERVTLPHPEIFAAMKVGGRLLVDDGKVRLRIIDVREGEADCRVEAGRKLSDRKGVNVPDAVLPMSALTEKDRRDVDFAMKLGVDWIALSFVQQPKDVIEARRIVGDSAQLMVKMEKPSAIHHLDELVMLADGMMVARGDLGVEMQPEEVPPIQRRIVQACRRAGKPVVVATQMLESMITNPVPTRAESSDVARAVYDGADAVMLSAESAAGNYPREAVAMMDRIIRETEQSSHYKQSPASGGGPATGSDAISTAACQVAETIGGKCIVTHTRSGRTAQRASRERPIVPIVMVTTERKTARQHTIVWGLHCYVVENMETLDQVVEAAQHIAVSQGFGVEGEQVVVTAGVPFGQVGQTNLLRLLRL
jgi:pyruvate kinase